jgi:hypothetical protein
VWGLGFEGFRNVGVGCRIHSVGCGV